MELQERLLAQAEKMAALVAEKNKAYGNSFAVSGDFLRLLYPNGARPDEYNTMLWLARVFDKLMRIANDPTAFGEDPVQDVMGYAMLELDRRQQAERWARIEEKLEGEERRPFVPLRASFRGADLRGVDFTGANLEGAIFDSANLEGASFTDALMDESFAPPGPDSGTWSEGAAVTLLVGKGVTVDASDEPQS